MTKGVELGGTEACEAHLLVSFAFPSDVGPLSGSTLLPQAVGKNEACAWKAGDKASSGSVHKEVQTPPSQGSQ